jgi:hypothetical protein
MIIKSERISTFDAESEPAIFYKNPAMVDRITGDTGSWSVAGPLATYSISSSACLFGVVPFRL